MLEWKQNKTKQKNKQDGIGKGIIIPNTRVKAKQMRLKRKRERKKGREREEKKRKAAKPQLVFTTNESCQEKDKGKKQVNGAVMCHRHARVAPPQKCLYRKTKTQSRTMCMCNNNQSLMKKKHNTKKS